MTLTKAEKEELAAIEADRKVEAEMRANLVQAAREARAVAIAAHEALMAQQKEVRKLRGVAGKKANAVLLSSERLRLLDEREESIRSREREREGLEGYAVVRDLRHKLG